MFDYIYYIKHKLTRYHVISNILIYGLRLGCEDVDISTIRQMLEFIVTVLNLIVITSYIFFVYYEDKLSRHEYYVKSIDDIKKFSVAYSLEASLFVAIYFCIQAGIKEKVARIIAFFRLY